MEGPERTTNQEAALAPRWGKKGVACRSILGDAVGAKQGKHASSSSSQPVESDLLLWGRQTPRQ